MTNVKIFHKNKSNLWRMCGGGGGKSSTNAFGNVTKFAAMQCETKESNFHVKFNSKNLWHSCGLDAEKRSEDATIGVACIGYIQRDMTSACVPSLSRIRSEYGCEACQ